MVPVIVTVIKEDRGIATAVHLRPVVANLMHMALRMTTLNAMPANVQVRQGGKFILSPLIHLKTSIRTYEPVQFWCFLVRIDGHWGRWSPWGYCTVNCNEGVQSRKRTCDDPKPANGGVACPHSMDDYAICLRPRCTLGNY